MRNFVLRELGRFGGLFWAACIGLAAFGAVAQASERAPDLILKGEFSGKDHQTYQEVPFSVPAGVTRLALDFSYTGKAERTTLDIGLRDPVRFRGWSGGARSQLVLGDGFATPSIHSGPLPPGVWKLMIGAPNIRRGSKSQYTARIWFDPDGSSFPGFIETVRSSQAGWYRGDLHSHTGHSDGTCLSLSGQRIPCPVFKTLEAAHQRGLDFLAITDHNTTSQNQSLAELAPYFDDLLILPGREITTFQGHANVWGPTRDFDFQLGTRRARTFDAIADQVHAAHGLVSINHPKLPSGEACMGCGWTAKTDWSKVDAVEVINGGSLAALGPEGPLSGIPFWEGLLDQGYRITAVGGSDNHDPDLSADKSGALGRPTTYVHAAALSQPMLLEGLRQGRVFVDLSGLPSPRFELRGQLGEQNVEMGGILVGRPGERVIIKVAVSGLPVGARLRVQGNAAGDLRQRDWAVSEDGLEVTLGVPEKPSWVRFDVRGAAGDLILLSNPIYIRPAS